MTKEEVYKIYGIDNDTLLNYDDIAHAYMENLKSEVSYENLNPKNIKKIADGFEYLHRIFYPEYDDFTSTKTSIEIYDEKHPSMEEMVTTTATILLKVNDELKPQDSYELITKIENNLERDYYARVEEPKKIKRLN